MSEEDNVMNDDFGTDDDDVVEEEEEEEDDSRGRLPNGNIRHRVSGKNVADLRHPRQKYCAKWEVDFPWLKAENLDESTGFCVVCSKHLVCKKSHLERHQQSFKHLRLTGFEVLDRKKKVKPEPSATEFFECGKREVEDDEGQFEQDAIEIDPDYSVEFELNPKQKKRGPKPKNPKMTKSSKVGKEATAYAKKLASTPKLTVGGAGAGGTAKLDRYKLLKRIDRDRHELNAFYARRQELSPLSGGGGIVIQPSRDSFDLFFDSVSASVKTLPPKLAAEVKGRVSQIIAEFELRAICEREAHESSVASESAVVVASTTHEMVATASVTHDGSLDASAVPHIVYTFQPKVRE